jgi:hypothetical protein
MIYAYSLTIIVVEVVHSTLITVQWNFSEIQIKCSAQKCFMKQLTCEGDFLTVIRQEVLTHSLPKSTIVDLIIHAQDCQRRP